MWAFNEMGGHQFFRADDDRCEVRDCNHFKRFTILPEMDGW